MRGRVTGVAVAALLVAGIAAAAVHSPDAATQETGASSAAGGQAPCRTTGEAARTKTILACVAPSLAFVETPLGTGSGILVEGRYVLTNAHVVDPFAAVSVVFAGGDRHEGVPVKGVDLMADIALVGPLDTDRRPLAIADQTGLEKGDDLYLVGYPGEVDEEPEATISRGILSRTRRAPAYGLTFLQTDAAIGGGQSGGALVDGRGRIVGVSGFSFAEEFALALSGPDTRRSVARIKAGKGAPYRPFPEGGETSGTFRLADTESSQVLTIHTGAEPQTVRLTLPSDSRPAVFAGDLDGEEVLFQNREALEAIEDSGGGPPVDDEDVDEPVAPGVYEIEIPKDTYAVILVGTRRPEGADMSFTSSVPLGRYDDGDEGGSIAVGDRREGEIDTLESGGDTYTVDLKEGDEVEIVARSATGDMGYAVRQPGQASRDAVFVDDSGAGLFQVDARDRFTAETSGAHRITVFAVDGVATAYVLEVS